MKEIFKCQSHISRPAGTSYKVQHLDLRLGIKPD